MKAPPPLPLHPPLPTPLTPSPPPPHPHPRHYNERDGVSNNRPLSCLLNHLFRRRSKNASTFRLTGLCKGNRWFPTTRGKYCGKYFHLIWWRHHVFGFDWLFKPCNVTFFIIKKTPWLKFHAKFIFFTFEIVGWFCGKMCFAFQLVYMYNHDHDIVRASQLIALVGKFPVHVVDLYQHCFSGADAYYTDFCWIIFLFHFHKSLKL